MDAKPLRSFLEIPYDELEQMNSAAKLKRQERVDPAAIAEERRRYLHDEKRIKAVTVCFSDLEGRFHMLDYDKKFLLKSEGNLTFDGSSIRGFSQISESDLKLAIDWAAFYWLPCDIFGAGKVITFGAVRGQDDTPYHADFRSQLQVFTDALYRNEGMTMNIAPEVEGFLFAGSSAEQSYYDHGKFEFISTGGYYHSLPKDPLRHFMDRAAEAPACFGIGQ